MCGMGSLIFDAASATEVTREEFEEYKDKVVRGCMMTIQKFRQRITKIRG
jgi:hypothetical protein